MRSLLPNDPFAADDTVIDVHHAEGRRLDQLGRIVYQVTSPGRTDNQSLAQPFIGSAIIGLSK